MSAALPKTKTRPAILQIVPKLETGGAERTTVDVAAALARAGFTAYVATEGGRMLNELADAGGVWLRFPANAKAPHRLLANALGLRNIIRAR
ncbi:MAG TPA: hypothetical protein VKB71_10340, partial [Rhizomicrobium sp.]|nr:hypothetical protein [Rhizomicrobium sp.]